MIGKSDILGIVNPVTSIIAKFGSQAALARAAGVSQPSVAGWVVAGRIPSKRQQLILDAARERGIALEPVDFFRPPATDAA